MTSFLTIDSLLHDDTGFTLEFTARAGVRYTVQLSDDLTTWQSLTTVEATPSERLASVHDPAATTHRFYRLVAERP